MPFLRVIKDKRGYETTYLLHWSRDEERQRSRILYVFRSPTGMPVGRDAFDADVRRRIERENPGIAFDWESVFRQQQVVEPPTELRRPRKRPPTAAPPAESQTPTPAPPPPVPPVPARIEGASPADQLAFLAHWYPEVRQRIGRRATDPERQAALYALAEHLNPAAWTDADTVTTGLAQAAEALERLSRLLSKRRRRGKKSGQSGQSALASQPGGPGPGEESSPDAGADEGDEAPDSDVETS